MGKVLTAAQRAGGRGQGRAEGGVMTATWPGISVMCNILIEGNGPIVLLCTLIYIV